MSNATREVFVKIAREELGVRETSRNQGPGIEKYWRDTTYKDGYRNREPYCAAFVCWVVAEAERRGFGVGPGPKFAAVRHIVDWARRPGSGAVVFNKHSAKYKPEAGDLVWWEFSGGGPNHIGIVEGTAGTTHVRTIEGNTNKEGSREGDGVWERRRSIAGTGGFIRLSWRAKPI